MKWKIKSQNSNSIIIKIISYNIYSIGVCINVTKWNNIIKNCRLCCIRLMYLEYLYHFREKFYTFHKYTIIPMNMPVHISQSHTISDVISDNVTMRKIYTCIQYYMISIMMFLVDQISILQKNNQLY